MPAAKKCPYCDLFYDDSLLTCPYCGSPNDSLQQERGVAQSSHKNTTSDSLAQSQKRIRNPWVAVIFSLLFIGWGHWYTGKRDDGIKS